MDCSSRELEALTAAEYRGCAVEPVVCPVEPEVCPGPWRSALGARCPWWEAAEGRRQC